MRKIFLVISLISVLCAFTIVSDALADPNRYLLGQETYLLQKIDKGSDPWLIIPPDPEEKDIAFGKLEYFNYAVGDGFSFDFKGYDFGVGEDGDPGMPIPAFDQYALIYYVDKAVGWEGGPPPVYVLGISSGPYTRPVKSKWKAKGLEGVDFKIAGSCPILQIPVSDEQRKDINYPNGGKIWLVPSQYLDTPTACSWTTWTGWPAGGAGILFETSLITYGFEYVAPTE